MVPPPAFQEKQGRMSPSAGWLRHGSVQLLGTCSAFAFSWIKKNVLSITDYTTVACVRTPLIIVRTTTTR